MHDARNITAVVICEDARTEVTGRQILIGTLPGVIGVPLVPAISAGLAIYFEFDFKGEPVKELRVRIVDPEERILADMTGALNVLDWADPAALSVQIKPMSFPTIGAYRIEVAFDGDKAIVAKTFHIALEASLQKRREAAAAHADLPKA